MAKLSGLFDYFDNLDAIDINSLISWIKSPPQNIQIENYLANKILYPSAIPLTEKDMEIDLAILREALNINGPLNQKQNSFLGENPFLNITLRKIIIPEKFLNYVPDLTTLTWTFVDALLIKRKKEDWFEDVWTVVVSGDSDEIVGTVILPQFSDIKGEMIISILGKNYKIKPGSLIVVPCIKDRCEVGYRLRGAKILGKEESALQLYGGKLGIVIDARL